MIERRTVVVSRSPPRRMLAPLRWRAFKTGPDRLVWEACWQPVQRLLEDGWRLVAVTVDWGPALPMTERWRMQTVRELTGCYADCEIRETAGIPGRGQTTVELERDQAPDDGGWDYARTSALYAAIGERLGLWRD